MVLCRLYSVHLTISPAGLAAALPFLGIRRARGLSDARRLRSFTARRRRCPLSFAADAHTAHDRQSRAARTNVPDVPFGRRLATSSLGQAHP